MGKMWRHKFCTNRECVQGFKGGKKPDIIWFDVKNFDLISRCSVCGNWLEMMQSVQAPTGVKRGRESDTPDERSADGDSDSKRLRFESTSSTRSGNMTGAHGGGTRGGPRGGARGGLQGVGRGFENPGPTGGLFLNFGGGANTEIRTDDEEAADAKRGGKGERIYKWCLKCHWSHHNTSECKGADRDIEPVVAELYWRAYQRPTLLSLLSKPPNDVYELMDQLTTHQMYFMNMKRFFAERDDLLQQVLEDGTFLADLQPELGDGETPTGIYETLVTKANCATKMFVVSVVQAIFVIFRAVVVGKRVRGTGETTPQFRARMARMVFESASAREFPLSNQFLETLKSSLDFAWKVYVGRMDNLEKEYLERHFSKQVMSWGQQRIVRLPTSYMRLEMMTEAEAKQLIFPVFKPVRIASLAEYKSHFFAHHLDDLYVPPEKLITGTVLQANDELTKVEMPDELDFLNIQGERLSGPVNIKSEDTQE